MFAQYFGQFLLNRKIVSAFELKQAMSAQKETRVRLGVLAINHGYLTAEQVETIHQAQTRMDKRFGEMAIDLGLLTNEQLTSMLSMQQPAHLVLGQVLIDQGIMNYERFEQALQQYKVENSLSSEQFESIISGNIDGLVEMILAKGGLSGNIEVIKYITLFAKNMIRFIDNQTVLELTTAKADGYDWVIQQDLMDGHGHSCLTAIGGTEASVLKLASIYAHEAIDEPGEMMEASIGEFLNLHNGIYLVNASNNGTELQMAPQSVVKGNEHSTINNMAAIVHFKGVDFSLDLQVSDLSLFTA